MSDETPSAKQKRQYYVVAFCFALGIDMIFSMARGIDYRPSLVGSAIMIAAVLYFAISWFRER